MDFQAEERRFFESVQRFFVVSVKLPRWQMNATLFKPCDSSIVFGSQSSTFEESKSNESKKIFFCSTQIQIEMPHQPNLQNLVKRQIRTNVLLNKIPNGEDKNEPAESKVSAAISLTWICWNYYLLSPRFLYILPDSHRFHRVLSKEHNPWCWPFHRSQSALAGTVGSSRSILAFDNV